jgi:hypothetical protein
MADTVPRLSGKLLGVLAKVMAGPAGAPLRRKLGAMVVEKKLATVDFAKEGDPAPLYMPPTWRR